MISQFSFLLFTLAISFAQIVDEDSAFDWLQFSKGTENDYVDDLESLEDFNQQQAGDILDVQDRSLGDYDLRETLPYNITCELQYDKVNWRPKHVPSPKYNITCTVANVNPLTQSRFSGRKSKFCIIKHQTPSKKHNLCNTRYIEIRESKNSPRMARFGVGCACHQFIQWEVPEVLRNPNHGY
ncbi:uncharacterized protein [Onthophagus taurus]|uniref:uncharacterized protein n=1 Tax=Onthophagus taurus TaxID=166361 RepID=UPI0039BE214F